MSRPSLAQQLALLDEPAPADFDPEDNFYADGANSDDEAAAPGEGDGREHYVEVGPSGLRANASRKNAALDDPKYAGKKSSRMAIFDDDDESEEEEEGGDEEEEDEEDEEEEGGAGEGMDADEADDSTLEGDEAAEEPWEPAAPFGAPSASPTPSLSPSPADSGSEDEDEDEDKAQPSRSAADAELLARLRTSAQADQEKGQAVKGQLALYDQLLTMRIGMQKAVGKGNDLAAQGDSVWAQDFQEDVQQTLAALAELSEGLFTLREKFVVDDGEISPSSLPSRKRPHSTSAAYFTAAAAYSQNLTSLYAPHLTATLQKTSARIALAAPGAAAASNKFKAVNQDAAAQVEDALREIGRLRERVGVRRGGPDGAAGAGEFDPEVFDDADFYQALLREVIDSRAGGAADGADDFALPAPKKKVKKVVDTKASKGRKLRYTPHEKLQNFMVPIPPGKEAWHEEQIDELFASLLGKGFGARGGAAEEEDELVAGDAERTDAPENLGGLRVFG